jgi:hypothetical protein
MAKRKVKVFGKMNLYEGSAVGLPAYPDAHLSGECSLIKSLGASFTDETEEIMGDNQLNLKGQEMENAKIPEVSKSVEVSKVPEVAKNEEVQTEKSVLATEIAKAIKEGMKEVLKDLGTERGLVENDKAKTDLSKKSMGELAMSMGLFVKN